MNKEISTEKDMAFRTVLLLLATVGFFVGWMLYFVRDVLTPGFEVVTGVPIYDVPEFLAFLFYFIFGLVPPMAVGGGAYSFAYFKWFIPNRTKLANEQLKKLSEAKNAMMSAVGYIEIFEEELKRKSDEAKKIHDEVMALKILNSENAEELERKLKAMESLTRNRIWFERIFAFVIGVMSSLAASYLWLTLQRM